MLWIVLGLTAALAAGVLLAALLRRPPPASSRAEHDLEVFRAQLRELEREAESGLLGSAEAAAARLEIQRRLLAADARCPTDSPASRSAPAVAVAVALAVPGAAFAVYLVLGNPGTPSITLAERAERLAPEEPRGSAMPDVETMMMGLEARLVERPDDLEGWLILGRTSVALGRPSRAIEAYDRALALDGDQAWVHAARGEALVVAAEGRIGEEARAGFDQALALDPGNAHARFYLAIAAEQDGNLGAALDGLAALLHQAPADAEWVVGVRERAAVLATRLGLDPAAVLPPADGTELGRAETGPRGPTARDMQAAESMIPEERMAMIRGMVQGLADRLEESPDDLDGWRRLARSYRVLGEQGKAEAAYRRVLALDGGNADALEYLGEAAERIGDREGAAALWRRLIGRLPAGGEERARIQARIDELGVKP